MEPCRWQTSLAVHAATAGVFCCAGRCREPRGLADRALAGRAGRDFGGRIAFAHPAAAD